MTGAPSRQRRAPLPPPALLVAPLFALLLLFVVSTPSAAHPALQEGEQQPAADGSRAMRGFENAMPADMQIFVGVADLDEFRAALADGPWGRLWADPGCATLRTALEQRLQDKLDSLGEKLEIDMDGVLAELHGSLAVGARFVFPLDGSEFGGDDLKNVKAEMLLLAGLAHDHQTVDRLAIQLIDGMCKGDRLTAKESILIDGHDALRAHKLRDGADESLLCLCTDDTLIIEASLGGRSYVEGVLDALDGQPTAEVLADQPRFASSIGSSSGGLQAWVDAQHFCDLLRSRIPPGSEAEERMGLFAIQDLAAIAMLDGDGSRIDLRVRWSDRGLLQKALECLSVPGPVDHLSSLSRDAKLVLTWRADLPRLFDVAVKELRAMNVLKTEQIVSKLSSFEEATGFALREDLLEALNGQMSFAVCPVDAAENYPGGPSDNPQNLLALIGLKDGTAFNTLLESVLRKRGLWATRQRTEFEGFELFNVSIFGLIPVNYAVLPDMLVLSPALTPVQELLRRRAGSDLPCLSEAANISAVLARLDPGRGVQLVTSASTAAYFVLATLQALELARSSPAELTSAAIVKALPSPALVEKLIPGSAAFAVTADEQGIKLEVVGP